eukprot:6421004-Amphidinium_carterae.1
MADNGFFSFICSKTFVLTRYALFSSLAEAAKDSGGRGRKKGGDASSGGKANAAGSGRLHAAFWDIASHP